MPSSDDPTSLGNVLIELGFCSQSDIDTALDEMEQRRIGEALVAMNVINIEQLDRAEKFQRLRRRQMDPHEEREFVKDQRSALITELSEMHVNTLEFCEKVNGGG